MSSGVRFSLAAQEGRSILELRQPEHHILGKRTVELLSCPLIEGKPRCAGVGELAGSHGYQVPECPWLKLSTETETLFNFSFCFPRTFSSI